MARRSRVNAQVVDAVCVSNAATVAMGPATTMSMTYAALTDSLGIAMHNAVATQRSAQTIAVASVATTCAQIAAVANKGSS